MDNIEKISRVLKHIRCEMDKAVFGQDRAINLLIVCMLADGHVLIEDVPGVGKTTLAMTMAKASGLKCSRIQFTPDTMPMDVTGFSVYNQKTDDFEYRDGAVMTNILLADEINRTSPKTQSALLEVMEEHRVTVDGKTRSVPEPFMVIATQNPHGFIGTHPLPEAQLDRFLMRISLGYPSREDEVNMISSRQTVNPLDSVAVGLNADVVNEIREVCRNVFVDERVKRYIVDIIGSTRENPAVELGASPRASLLLMKAAQACALLNSRDYVIPEDVAYMVAPVVAHRLSLTAKAKTEKRTPEDILGEIVSSIKPPFIERTSQKEQ